MKRFSVTVTQIVVVEIDETKLTPEFMEEFRQSMYPYRTLAQHAEHLGQLMARGIVNDLHPNPFVEGYGPLKDMGVKLEIDRDETEIEAREIDGARS